jgi:hypothetical protein
VRPQRGGAPQRLGLDRPQARDQSIELVIWHGPQERQRHVPVLGSHPSKLGGHLRLDRSDEPIANLICRPDRDEEAHPLILDADASWAVHFESV